MIEWHHLLGLTLTDFFTDTFYDEMEADLSKKSRTDADVSLTSEKRQLSRP